MTKVLVLTLNAVVKMYYSINFSYQHIFFVVLFMTTTYSGIFIGINHVNSWLYKIAELNRKKCRDMLVEEFLSRYDSKVEHICLQLRAIVFELLPETEEILFEGWKNISYGTGESRGDKDLIIYIAPFKDSVNLGFYRGALLADKNKLLIGTGKLLRHVKFRSISDHDSIEIKKLIVAAKMERFGKI